MNQTEESKGFFEVGRGDKRRQKIYKTVKSEAGGRKKRRERCWGKICRVSYKGESSETRDKPDKELECLLLSMRMVTAVVLDSRQNLGLLFC